MTDAEKPVDSSIGEKAVRGAAWMVALRWAFRLLGLVSSAVLARLLTPYDFGVVAMAMIVYALFDTMASSGVEAAIIRMKSPDSSHYDTAWTINLGLGTMIAAVLAILAPFLANYLNEPALTNVLLVFALVAVFRGGINIGTVEFKKELHLRPQFIWQVGSRFFGLIATIILAVVLRNYWAIALGLLANSGFRLIGSFVIHPYRPKLSMKAWADLVSFSLWSFLNAIGGFLVFRLDQIFLAGAIPAARLGLYNVASNLADMVSRELMVPLNPIAYSAYSKLQEESARLRRGVIRAVGLAAYLGIPAGLGVAVLADDIVYVILGDQWGDAGPILQILVLITTTWPLHSMLSPLAIADGRIRTLTIFIWLQAAIIAIALFWLVVGEHLTIQSAAMVKTSVAVALAIVFSWVVLRLYKGLFLDVILALVRPLFASVVMTGVLLASFRVVELDSFASVGLRIPLGVLVFCSVAYLTWMFSGRPDGAESESLERISVYWHRFGVWFVKQFSGVRGV